MRAIKSVPQEGKATSDSPLHRAKTNLRTREMTKTGTKSCNGRMWYGVTPIQISTFTATVLWRCSNSRWGFLCLNSSWNQPLPFAGDASQLPYHAFMKSFIFPLAW